MHLLVYGIVPFGTTCDHDFSLWRVVDCVDEESHPVQIEDGVVFPKVLGGLRSCHFELFVTGLETVQKHYQGQKYRDSDVNAALF